MLVLVRACAAGPRAEALIEFFLGAPGHVQEQLLAREIGSFLAPGGGCWCCGAVAAVAIVVVIVVVAVAVIAIVIAAVATVIAIVFRLFVFVVVPSQIDR